MAGPYYIQWMPLKRRWSQLTSRRNKTLIVAAAAQYWFYEGQETFHIPLRFTIYGEFEIDASLHEGGELSAV